MRHVAGALREGSVRAMLDADGGRVSSLAQLERELIRIVEATPWLVRALAAVRALALPDGCIGAGALRNAVWDALHGHAAPSYLADVDVAYYDPADLSRERDAGLQEELRRAAPELPWEVVNQAGVHLWYPQVFGPAVEPLRSLEDAIASWPETATCVGLRVERDGGIRVVAPLGLDDLFAMIIRRNPRRVSVETYRRRIAQKRYAERWPRVRIVPE